MARVGREDPLAYGGLLTTITIAAAAAALLCLILLVVLMLALQRVRALTSAQAQGSQQMQQSLQQLQDAVRSIESSGQQLATIAGSALAQLNTVNEKLASEPSDQEIQDLVTESQGVAASLTAKLAELAPNGSVTSAPAPATGDAATPPPAA